MKKSDVVKRFIKISAINLMHIINYSGLNIKCVRTGNKYHSTRNFCLYSPYKNKQDWPVIAYSYSGVVKDGFTLSERNLEVSEIYLNPDFKYLLEK